MIFEVFGEYKEILRTLRNYLKKVFTLGNIGSASTNWYVGSYWTLMHKLVHTNQQYQEVKQCNLALLSQHSAPFTSFGTRKRAANFSVSVSACSRTLMHFLTGSARCDLLSDVVSDGVFDKPVNDRSEAFAIVVKDVVIFGINTQLLYE